MDKMDKQTAGPDVFSGGFGFVLACVGAAVGLGNIWRFPVLLAQFGGLTFLIPYLIFVALIASTGVMGEYALGRASGFGPVGAFAWAGRQRGWEKIGRGLGVLPMIGAFGLAIGYSVVLGWVAYYLYLAASGRLLALGHNLPKIKETFAAAASAGGNTPAIIIVSLFCLLIVGAGIVKGIERANRILLPLLTVLFLALFVYIAFLPGASAGFDYIFTLEPHHLLNPKVWIFAFGQAFFSLSVAGNMGVIFGSYLPSSEDIPKSALKVAVFDTLAAMLAALVIIPAMATTGAQLSVGGPGLMFIYLVDVFNGMAGGWPVAAVFFLCVTSAGITSLITLYEPPIALVRRQLNCSRWLASLLVLLAGGSVAVSIQAVTAQWMDVISIYVCPLGALLAGVAYFWMVSPELALAAVNEGASRPQGPRFLWLGKYVFCTATLVALIAGICLGGIG
ncbi:MAG: sodium-dependent transporter [bacterium]|nr:sodium-dependent transporter [bacterium]